MIDHNHPAVEAAAMTLYADRAELEGWNDTWESEDERVRSNWRVHALEVLTAAREHYTADDLRDAPAGRELMAEAWDAAITLLWRDYEAIDSGEFSDARIANPYRAAS